MRKAFEAWRAYSQDTPLLTAFGSDDKVMAGVERSFHGLPGAQGQAHVILPDAGHFLQEDVGDALADLTLSFIAVTSG